MALDKKSAIFFSSFLGNSEKTITFVLPSKSEGIAKETTHPRDITAEYIESEFIDILGNSSERMQALRLDILLKSARYTMESLILAQDER